MKSAHRERLAPAQLHHQPGHDPGGDGRSTAAAISVVGTKNILEDIVAKRRWVQTRLPAGARHTGIERADSGGKSWDVMVARMPNGQPAKFYFNKYVDPARDAGK